MKQTLDLTYIEPEKLQYGPIPAQRARDIEKHGLLMRKRGAQQKRYVNRKKLPEPFIQRRKNWKMRSNSTCDSLQFVVYINAKVDN